MDYRVEREALVVHVTMMVELALPIRRDRRPALKRVCVDMECPEGAKVMHGGHVYRFCCFKISFEFDKSTPNHNPFDKIEIIFFYNFFF